MTIAEAIKLKPNLKFVPDRPQPDNYHARTGHVLPNGISEVQKQLDCIQNYAVKNQMVLNTKKTKAMIFNNGKSMDFMPTLEVQGCEIEVVEEMRLLGLIIRSDLKWSSNSEHITLKAFGRLWILRRLKALGAKESDLLDVYLKQVRSVLELAVPAWHPGLTAGEATDIERVQISALNIILGMDYTSYSTALDYFNLETLDSRRDLLCKNFEFKAARNPKHANWFKLNVKTTNTRLSEPKFKPVIYRTTRFQKSPLSYLTSLLNKYSK